MLPMRPRPAFYVHYCHCMLVGLPSWVLSQTTARAAQKARSRTEPSSIPLGLRSCPIWSGVRPPSKSNMIRVNKGLGQTEQKVGSSRQTAFSRTPMIFTSPRHLVVSGQCLRDSYPSPVRMYQTRTSLLGPLYLCNRGWGYRSPDNPTHPRATRSVISPW